MGNFQKYWSQNVHVGQDFIVHLYLIFFTGGRFWKLMGETEGTLKIGRKMLPPEDSHRICSQSRGWILWKKNIIEVIITKLWKLAIISEILEYKYMVFNKIALNRLNWNLKRLHDKKRGYENLFSLT
jgi:hypothetical protein